MAEMIFFGEKLIDEKLLGTTLKWCLSRVSTAADAEDLTQDILLHTVTALRKGNVPEWFYPWYWQLAHNRYCAFLKKRRYGAELLSEFSEGGEVACGAFVEENFFADDERAKLNRAVSRLSAIHRDLVIRYYLKNETIPQIAEATGMPEGTVKRCLFDARAEIRKGVETMKEYTGMSAYAPADLNLSGGFGIPKYWGAIEDLLTKQIFVACMSVAKTIQEIADEIGVAPVYFEKKLAYLLENKFIKEMAKGKYLTDFVIFPRQVHSDFYYERAEILHELGEEITVLVRDHEKDIRSMDFYGNDMPYDYLMWLLYYYACLALQQRMKAIYMKKHSEKMAGFVDKGYLVYGTVLFPDEKLTSRKMRVVVWSNMHNTFKTADYDYVTYANLYEHKPFGDRDSIIGENNIRTVMKLYEDPTAVLDADEQMQAAELIEKGYLEKREDGLYLTFPVLDEKARGAIQTLFYQSCGALAEKYEAAIAALGERILLPHVRKDLDTLYFCHIMPEMAFWTYSNVLYYAMNEEKTLAIPDDWERSAADIVLYVKKK